LINPEYRLQAKPVGEQLVDVAAGSLLARADPGERQVSTPWHDIGTPGLTADGVPDNAGRTTLAASQSQSRRISS
jgi:hypothetical protein